MVRKSVLDEIQAPRALQVVLLDREDLVAISKNPTAVIEILEREAEHAMDVKGMA